MFACPLHLDWAYFTARAMCTFGLDCLHFLGCSLVLTNVSFTFGLDGLHLARVLFTFGLVPGSCLYLARELFTFGVG